jgi:hypothetical protein
MRDSTDHSENIIKHVVGAIDGTPRARRRRQSRLAGWTLVACLLPVGLAGQTPSAAPAPARRALAEPFETMLLTVSLSGTTSEADNAASAVEEWRPAGDVDAAVAYHRRGKRVTTDVRGQSTVRRVDGLVIPLRQAGAIEVAAVGQRQRLHMGGGVSAMSAYQFGGGSAFAPPAELDGARAHGDLANAPLDAVELNSSVDWSRSIGGRSALTASYTLRRTTFDRPALDMTSQELAGTLVRRIARYVSLRAGYGYRVVSTPTLGAPMHLSDIAAGIDLARPITVSRRTSLTLRSGSSLVPANAGALGVVVTGDAMLTRRLGRNWSLRGGVNRSVRLAEGFTAPLVDNSLTATFGGPLRRRLAFSTSGLLSMGTVGVTADGTNGYRSWASTSALTMTLSRNVTLAAQYFWIGNRFQPAVQLPAEVVRDGDRRGARVDFTWRVPLVQNR